MTNKKQTYFEDELVKAVREDFNERQKQRRHLELQWELNLNFIMGNQYCDVSLVGELQNEDSDFFWQSRQVFNHISPIIDTRLAKLLRVKPIMSVRAASSEDGDLKTAKISSNALNATYSRLNMEQVIEKATMWSEACGTSFYKVIWNSGDGSKVGSKDGADIFEGDVKVAYCPPFEIYPDSIYSEEVENLNSIIHAKAMPVSDIEDIYGVTVEGEDIEEYSISSLGAAGANEIKAIKKDHAIVIEKYEKVSKKLPSGQLTIVAGDKLLYRGELPYINGESGERVFPFIKQDSIKLAGCFFGMSMVERLIPIQRAYNTVRNRKHEFLNRVSMGIMAVEDGSIDTDELAEEGLSPGKILVYRQGSRPPAMMTVGNIPPDFTYEEERLSNEFLMISGVSEISRNSVAPTNVTSGIALQLLIEQDDTRLTVTAESIRKAVKEVAKHMLRLLKQFATELRMMRMTGDGKKVEIHYFKGSDISSDDVVFETENEMSVTPTQKKSLIFELYKLGLLADEDGVIKNATRTKILDALGYGSFDNAYDISALQKNRAESENLKLLKKSVDVEEYDDTEVHLNEHIRFMLSSEFDKYEDKKIKERFIAHIQQHKKAQLFSGDLSQTEEI